MGGIGSTQPKCCPGSMAVEPTGNTKEVVWGEQQCLASQQFLRRGKRPSYYSKAFCALSQIPLRSFFFNDQLCSELCGAKEIQANRNPFPVLRKIRTSPSQRGHRHTQCLPEVFAVFVLASPKPCPSPCPCPQPPRPPPCCCLSRENAAFAKTDEELLWEPAALGFSFVAWSEGTSLGDERKSKLCRSTILPHH